MATRFGADGMSLSALLENLGHRIEAFDRGDPSAVLDERAVAEAGELWRMAVDAGGGVPEDVVRLLAHLHWCRYQGSPGGGNEEDLEAAMELSTPLVAALRERVARTDRPEVLDELVDVLTLIARALPSHHPERAGTFSDLGIALRMRYERTDGLADLDAAVTAGREAVDATPAGHLERAAVLLNAGNSLTARFGRYGRRTDLDEAVVAYRQALSLASVGHPDQALYLSSLGNALALQSKGNESSSDVDEAVRACRQAVASIPRGHPDWATMVSNLGLALQARFECTGASFDLDEAVDLARQAFHDTPREHPYHGTSLANLGLVLKIKYANGGGLEHVDEAIDAYRRAIRATPAGHSARAVALCDLGVALQARYAGIGDMRDLDEAVEVGRQAVETAETAPNREGRLPLPVMLNNLGAALHARFDQLGAATDLDEAVTVERLALRVSPAGSVDRAMVQSNLCGVLLARSFRSEDPADLDDAVDMARQAVAASVTDDAGQARRLSNLGLALQARYARGRARADLDEAVEAGRRAVAGTSAGDPGRARRLQSLGGSLLTAYQDSGSQQDLDDAVETSGQALQATPVDHPDRAGRLSQYGLAAYTRFDRPGGQVRDLDEAVTAWAEASASQTAPITVRMQAARQWAESIAQARGPAAALGAYTAAISLLPLLAWRGVSRLDQQHLLHEHAAALARESAACAIAAGQPELAAELLEHGRGVLWVQLLDIRTDLTALEQVDSDLATQLQDCRATLDQHPEPFERSDPLPSVRRDRLIHEARMRAARRLDEIVESVRAMPPTDKLPHPESFLTPTPLPLLLPLPEQGPTVVINISRWRCDALILSHRGVAVLELPELTEQDVIVNASRYLQTLHDLEQDGDPAEHDVLSAERTVTATLQWLWDTVTQPILDHLGHTSTPIGAWPRLWWCPTGALTLLPLHAAGYHGMGGGSVLDRVVSSYTPTLRALSHARACGPSQHRHHMLVITVPHTPGQVPLPAAGRERDAVMALFDSRHSTVLADEAATWQAITDNLGRHRWMHASCHGVQDLTAPSEGGLIPYDWAGAGLVSVTDLTRTDNIGGDFAFLSACKSASGGAVNLDEVITVAAAMQYAGWRHVISTLWTVPDFSAVAVTKSVYPQLVHERILNPDGAAQALHHAIRTLRDRLPQRPITWASFIHIGP